MNLELSTFQTAELEQISDTFPRFPLGGLIDRVHFLNLGDDLTWRTPSGIVC